MASYDEKKAAWVLEAGTYYIRVGNSSRTTKVAAALNLKETVVTVQGKNLFPADDAPQELSKAGVTPYSYEGEAEEKAAAKQIDICSKCIKTETVVYSETPEAFPAYEGEKLTAADVKSGKATLKDLVSQLTVEEMLPFAMVLQTDLARKDLSDLLPIWRLEQREIRLPFFWRTEVFTIRFLQTVRPVFV